MNEVLVIDDWLEDPDLVNYLSDLFLYNTPHLLAQTSLTDNRENSGDFYIWQYNIIDHGQRGQKFDNDIINFLVKKINKVIKDHIKLSLRIGRAYINIQHKDQFSYFHTDGCDLTILYMATPTPASGSQFEIYENDELKTIDFKQNRLIIFPGNTEHRGVSPDTPSPRITLAFKTHIV